MWLPPALKCPPGSHYTSCGPACSQPSCQNPAGHGGSCDLPCVEGCICDTGLILSGDKCVPISQCGCTDGDGKYRPVGVQWEIFLFARKCVLCKGALNFFGICLGWRHLVHKGWLLRAMQVCWKQQHQLWVLAVQPCTGVQSGGRSTRLSFYR